MEKTDWKNLNWTMRDVDLAKQLGVSREYVRQKRKQVGAAPSPFYRKHAPSVKALLALAASDKPMTLKEAKKKTRSKISEGVLRSTLHELDIFKRVGKHPQRVTQADLWALNEHCGITLDRIAKFLGYTAGGVSWLMYGDENKMNLSEATQKKVIRLMKRRGLVPSCEIKL